MYKFQGRDNETQQTVTKSFATREEAEMFGQENSSIYSEPKITPFFGDINGVIENEEQDDYNEEEELQRMGLADEETEEGFDWTMEDKSVD